MANDCLIDFYRICFLSMTLKSAKGRLNYAKPVLLFSVFDAIDRNVVSVNKLIYNAIKPLYEEKLAMYQDEHTPLRYPFFYMKNDGFWRLKWNPDSPVVPIAPSDKFLRDNLSFAMLDNALWDLLQDRGVRDYFRKSITDYYKMTTKTK